MSVTKDAGARILAFLFPPTCLACGTLEGIRSLPMGLCSRCRSLLERLEVYQALAVPQPLSALDAAISRWSYRPPLDAVIHALKFGRLEFLGPDLADALHSSVRASEKEFDVVVPIPLHWHRRLKRGYNQAEAIARPLAVRLRLPCVQALRRNRRTKPQAQMSGSQREVNLRLAFAPIERRCGTITGQRLLLVDDVVTTGATLEAAASCLRSQGAGSVTAITAGRTPVRAGGCTLDSFDKKLLNWIE